MPTATEQRVSQTLHLAPGLLKLIEEEAARTSASFSLLVRRALLWHSGKGMGRHPDSPDLKLARPRSKKPMVKKATMIEQQDADYLDALSYMYGLPRTTIIVLTLCQYLGLPVAPPRDK